MSQAWLEQTREAWAQEANQALEQAGRGERIERTAGDISWIEQELRQVERAIREMAERTPEQARRLMDRGREHNASNRAYVEASRIAFTGPSRPPKILPIGTNSPRLRCMAYSPLFLLVGADSGLEQNQRDTTSHGHGQEAEHENQG